MHMSSHIHTHTHAQTHRYTILDSNAEGAVFISVEHAETFWGNVYRRRCRPYLYIGQPLGASSPAQRWKPQRIDRL